VRKSLGLLTVLAASSLLVGLSAGQAFGATVHCGDTIMQDTRVDNDLSGCSGFAALAVSGENVTLDLDNHTISGDASSGIFVAGTVTVRDGTVSGFHDGVTIAGKTTRAYVTRITATGNDYGFQAIRGETLFEQNLAIGNLIDGFRAFSSVGTSVSATFVKNRAYSNGHLGINTNRTDGGKNHAHENGDPRQCVGVVCRP
jgi:hypothetical protein